MTATTATVAVPETINQQSLNALRDAIDRATAADIVVLRSAHTVTAGSIFCLGLDFAQLAGLSEADLLSGLQEFAHLLCQLRRGPFATVAVVTGETIGGGVGLAAACDMIIATELARFGLPEPLYGFAPAIVATILRERISPQAIRLLSLRCEAIDAKEAERIGLVDQVARPDDMNRILGRTVRQLGRTQTFGRRAVKEKMLDGENLEHAMERAVSLTHAWLTDSSIKERICRTVSGEAP